MSRSKLDPGEGDLHRLGQRLSDPVEAGELEQHVLQRLPGTKPGELVIVARGQEHDGLAGVGPDIRRRRAVAPGVDAAEWHVLVRPAVEGATAAAGTPLPSPHAWSRSAVPRGRPGQRSAVGPPAR